jgi:signal transduction histidine kinase
MSIMRRSQVNHLVRLVDDLLNLSRITRGRIDRLLDRKNIFK